MVLGTCISCQFGDHDGHREIIQAAPKGMMGGAMCGCKGECQGKPVDRVQNVLDMLRSGSERRGDDDLDREYVRGSDFE